MRFEANLSYWLIIPQDIVIYEYCLLAIQEQIQQVRKLCVSGERTTANL